MRSSRPLRRLRALSVALLAAGALALAGEDPRFDPQVVAQVRARLATPERGPAPILEEVVAGLVALGPQAAPVLFAELCGELEQGPEEAPRGAREEGALLGALAGLPEAAVLAELGQRCGGEAPLARKLAALRVLERRASSTGFALWLALARGLDPLERDSAFVADPLRRSLSRMLARDERTLAALAEVAPGLEAELCDVVTDAVLASKRGEALGLLLELLERRPGERQETALLRAATTLVVDNELPCSDELAGAIRARLFAREASLRTQCAEAIWRLEITRALPELIELLGDADRRVQRQARASLEGLSGQRLGYAPEPWRRWWLEQERWLAGDGARCLRVLEDGQPAAVVRALAELAQHRLLRDELLEPLAVALGRPEAELVVAACAALRQLGSARAAPWLVELLDDPDARVRDAAHAALRALLHADLPPEEEPWLALIESRAS